MAYLLCLLLLPGLLSGSVRRSSTPATPATGSIEGRVLVAESRGRLARTSYTAGSVARRVDPLPAVVMLVGRVPGGSAGPQARVVQRDTSFQPSVVIVQTGATVAFPNDDPFFHNVFSYSRPRRFDLGRYPRGESKSVRFDTPGVVTIFCEVHSWMRGAVVVTENPFHAIADADGSFRLADVPPGRHRLRVWHFDRGEVETDVQVPEGGTVRVELTLQD